MKNCVVTLNGEWETGYDQPLIRIGRYKTAMDALNVYANTRCFWSQLYAEEDAERIAEKALEMYKAGELDEDTYIS